MELKLIWHSPDKRPSDNKEVLGVYKHSTNVIFVSKYCNWKEYNKNMDRWAYISDIMSLQTQCEELVQSERTINARYRNAVHAALEYFDPNNEHRGTAEDAREKIMHIITA